MLWATCAGSPGKWGAVHLLPRVVLRCPECSVLLVLKEFWVGSKRVPMGCSGKEALGRFDGVLWGYWELRRGGRVQGMSCGALGVAK
eukprot:5769271-Alexandrium_andersonii.AAC.1